MAQGYEVLQMLIPDGGWEIKGDTYSGITFLECDAITEKEFNDGFAKVDAWKAKVEKDNADAKAALLTRLGITSEEAQLLLA